jgi:hypothetical protein
MLAALQLTGIIIRNDMDGVDGYIAHLCFHADFEEELGVGVLTDVRKVLGTGYLEDVTPYGFKYDET